MPRSVLVTGCSSGIGKSVAFGLKARGYRVYATARRPADVAALREAGLDALFLDLDSSESIRIAVDEVLSRTAGRLHGLVNNAAYGQPGAVEDLSREALRAQFETNLFGTHELTARLLPAFRARNEGRIVQISSLLGLVCLAYRGAYNASKFALEALTDTLRLELRGSGIRISLVEPGPIATRFRDNAYAAYKRHIDPTGSVHRSNYEHMERRLAGRGGPLPFTLPAEAVLPKVVHALEARRPRPRYAVTVPTRFFAVARRLLPTTALDRLLWRVSGAGRR
ncbi:oxidoreductase [Sulfurifustis variabilis]|uniref:Oxidoreductase n=1 Tax=Sulfurifustis variabilis TaxID=1675686 RepID=A0A1B4V5Q0_9GAMM|nr:SDR family NAD(P)-dependent oxidoreductase [Sulfurifustis variabilis]BAU48869.1 oxidoreductase [Sulfurifustis variabilis]